MSSPIAGPGYRASDRFLSSYRDEKGGGGGDLVERSWVGYKKFELSLRKWWVYRVLIRGDFKNVLNYLG